MDEKIIYEYCVVRYVADIEREEFINVGLMMMCKRHRWMRCALNIDETKIKTLSSKADTERLRMQLALFMRKDVPAGDITVEERYRWLAAVKSAIIQTSPSHPGLIFPAIQDNPENKAVTAGQLLNEKFDELFHRLVL